MLSPGKGKSQNLRPPHLSWWLCDLVQRGLCILVLCGGSAVPGLARLEKEVLKIEEVPSLQLCWSVGVFLLHVGLPWVWQSPITNQKAFE